MFARSISRSVSGWRALGVLFALFVSYASFDRADAQQAPAVVRPGDAVVTGFSGSLPPGPDLPAEVHPLDRTYLDLDGITARIFDLTQLGGAPQGQLADAPIRLSLKARQIGHVFGTAFDGDGRNGPPNIYLAATSVYGLQIVMPRQGHYAERVMTGRPGAEWMPGLFGEGGQGSPGTIWKVDGRTGAVTRFAEIRTGDLENSGAGLGALAYDPRSRHLYVSDMETGMIWRLSMDGRIVDGFDHGTQGRAAAGLEIAAYNPATRIDKTNPAFNTEMPETWGFAEPERRVWGLAIDGDRLYYSVAEGPKIWSVSINPDGSFGDDARLEIDVTGTPAGHMISAIMFDGRGTMYLSQRGTHLGNYDYSSFARPQEAMVIRYRWIEAEGRWSPQPEEYAVGLKHEHRSTLGGVALNYGYDRFGNIDYGRCRETLWTTGEHLREGSDIVRVTNGGPRLVSGLQGMYKSRVKPDNEPPFESWFIDYDARFDDVDAFGHIGNVAIYGPCQGAVIPTVAEVAVPVWTGGPNLIVEKRCYSGVYGGRVRCEIVVRNTGNAVAGDTIELIESTRIQWGPGVGTVIPITAVNTDGPEWVCAPNADGDQICRLPGDLLEAGGERRIEVWVDTTSLLAQGNVGFRNCVTLRHPHGRGKACAEGGADIVVKKTAPAQCLPGSDCKFEVTISNTGLTPFTGDILLADTLFIGGAPANAPISSIAPPLGCSSEPTVLPFSCLTRVTLGPGESRTHHIAVKLEAPANSWVQNCFGVFEPWVLSDVPLMNKLLQPVKFKAGTAPPGGYPSCVWVKVPGPISPVTKGPTAYVPTFAYGSQLIPVHDLPPEWTCPDGRPPLASGRCPCPLNAPYNPETGRCGWRPVCWDNARLRADGSCCPWGTVYWAGAGVCRPPPTAGCPDIWRRAADGSCCPRGMRSVNGVCRPVVVEVPCGWNEVRNSYGICVKLPIFIPLPIPSKHDRYCQDGRLRLPNGQCPVVTCTGGRKFNPRTGHCDLVITGVPTPTPVPTRCPLNFVRNAKGECVPPAVGTGPCGPGLTRNILGKCVPSGTIGTKPCPLGTTRAPNGACIGRPPSPVPPPKLPVPPPVVVPQKLPPVVEQSSPPPKPPVPPPVVVPPKRPPVVTPPPKLPVPPPVVVPPKRPPIVTPPPPPPKKPPVVIVPPPVVKPPPKPPVVKQVPPPRPKPPVVVKPVPPPKPKPPLILKVPVKKPVKKPEPEKKSGPVLR